MLFKLKDVFDEYSNPIFIIRPIMADGTAEDFEYVYVNNAFSLFLGINKNELMGHRFKEYFEKGERKWLDAFVKAAAGRKHIFVDNVSMLINRKMYTEIFHIEPDMCGCIIHDYKTVSRDDKSYEIVTEGPKLDSLTGFYNRFHLSEFQNEISKKPNIGITYIDINHLKATNTKLGRQEGDKLIIKLSDMMRKHYKKSKIYRMSGDEFVIITEDCNAGEFEKLSEEGKNIFGNNNLAAVGYKFYEKIEDLKDCISQCELLMNKHKEHIKQHLGDTVESD